MSLQSAAEMERLRSKVFRLELVVVIFIGSVASIIVGTFLSELFWCGTNVYKFTRGDNHDTEGEF